MTTTLTRKVVSSKLLTRSIKVSNGSIKTLFSAPASKRQDLIIRSSYPEYDLPVGNLAEYVLERGKARTKDVALLDGFTGRTLTYGELVDWVYRWGAIVKKKSKAAVPMVGMFMFNSPDYSPIFLGTMLVGGISTTLNSAYTPSEVAYQLQNSGTDILVADSFTEKTALAAIEILKENPTPQTIPELFVCGTSTSGRTDLRTLLGDKSAPYADVAELSPHAVCSLPYSSGTTGRPKGVRVKHSSIMANIAMYNNETFSLPLVDGDGQHSVLALIPFSHIYGIICFSALSIFRGAKMITLPGFQEKLFLDTINTHKPTILPIVPPLLKFMVESSDITKESLSGTRQVVCGAAPVPKTSAQKLMDQANNTDILFQEGFGMTEILATLATPRDDPKIGYCGKLLSNVEARIVDPTTKQDKPVGERGELYVRGPTLMEGYHNNEAATNETIDKDGWMHTGDIAIYHENGFFSIVDRMKELIKVKGLQVSPSELEDELLNIPGVADAGVVGIPHAKYGEVPKAFIIRSDKGDSISKDTINKQISVKLSKHKQLLGGITFVKELPKNPSGKLLRKDLKEMASKESSD